MSGLKLKEGLDWKSGFTNTTQDLPISQVSSLRTNMLLSVQCKKDHMPTTTNSVFSDKYETLEDKHLKCTSQIADKPLLSKSESVPGLKGTLARQHQVVSNVDWGCDQTSDNKNSGLELSTQDNIGLWSTESSSLDDGGPDRVGKLTSTTCHQKRKRKLKALDVPEELNTVASLDSQANDELSKGELMNGSPQIKISNVRSVFTFDCVPRPETSQVKCISTKSQKAVDEWKQENKDMVLKSAISDQSNENGKMSDSDSEHSSSSLNNDDDCNWDSQKEFLTFLWDNLDQNQKKTAEMSAHLVKQKRASMDTDYANSGHHNHTDPLFIKSQGAKWETTQAVRRNHDKEHVKCTKKCIKGKQEGTDQISTGCERSVFKEELLESGSNVEPLIFPCTNCDIVYKDRTQLHSHMRQHGEPVSQVQTLSLTCRECGWSFCDSAALLQHRSVHSERRHRLTEEMKKRNYLKNVDRDASLQHALCLYETNTCAQHAKTLEKEKLDSTDSQSLAKHNIYRNQIQNMEPDALSTILDAENTEVPLTGTKNPNVSENTENDNHFPSSEQYSLSTSPLSFQKLEGIPSTGKCSYSHSERMPNLKIEKSSQNHDKGVKSMIIKSANVPVSQNTDEQSGHDYRSDSKEWRTGSFLNGHNCCCKTIFSEECENSAQENKDNSSHTSEATFLPQQMDIMDSTFQWQRNFKDVMNISGKQSLANDPLKMFATPPHCMKSHDVSLDLPICKYSLKKEELNSTSVKNSHKKLTVKCGANGDVGHVGRNGVSSLFVENDEMNLLNITDESNKKGAVCVHSSEVLLSHSDLGEKNCPCCPAMIETGVSLSNHINRHPRVGVGYNVQHVIPSQQTFLDKHPPTCRKIASVAEEGNKESEQIVRAHAESQDELTCPLCGVRFDTKKGLSNHVRGHLKRMGKAYSTTLIRSPLDILKQLMMNDPFLLSIGPITKKDQNCCESLAEERDKNTQFKTTDSEKCSPSSDLIGMLKKRKSQEVKNTSHTTRKALTLPLQQTESLSEQIDRVHAESQDELACPLCGVRFDTKTGLSNHVRGHLKRLGKAYSTTSIRSPLDILKQLMSKREKFQKTVQAFQKRHSTSTKHSRNDPFLLSIGSMTKNDQNCCEALAEEGYENDLFEIPNSEKCSPSSDLIGMLKKRKSQEVKNTSHTTRKALTLPLQQMEFLSEKKKNNRKVCGHCNETFHSGVSLSNHLRAYEKRKRAALHYGKTYDCKRRRSRSGSKKSLFPLSYTTEEMYRLTCRFCDLVFQGPLSVQEDWIKHLQRHVINTSVPHTGACMVEVTSWPMDPNSETKTEASIFD